MSFSGARFEIIVLRNNSFEKFSQNLVFKSLFDEVRKLDNCACLPTGFVKYLLIILPFSVKAGGSCAHLCGEMYQIPVNVRCRASKTGYQPENTDYIPLHDTPDFFKVCVCLLVNTIYSKYKVS